MSNTESKKVYVKTESYSLVLNEAVCQAMAVSEKMINHVVTPSDLFKALCVMEPGVFSELLGKEVIPPKVDGSEHCHNHFNLTFSPELDRYLSPYGGVMVKMLDKFPQNRFELTALNIAAALVYDPIPEVENMLSVNGISAVLASKRAMKTISNIVNASEAEKRRKNLPKMYENIGKIREYLTSRCFGQDAAIDTILTQLSTVWGLKPEARGPKPISFFFFGASGTGKSHLTKLMLEAFENILDIPSIPVLDFAKFSTDQMTLDLIGRDTSWKDGGREGELTHRADENPRGIIVIDNFELGHCTAMSYLNTAMETGFLTDGLTGKSVCFSNNIFIIMTNSKELAESDEFLTMVSQDKKMPPKDKLVEGLVKFQPSFKFTLEIVDAPVLFMKHEFKSFFTVLRNSFLSLERQLSETFDAECDFESEEVYRLLVGMHPQTASVHPIVCGLESMVLNPIQNFLREHLNEFKQPRRIRVECDPLPYLEGAPKKTSHKAIDEDWIEKLTQIRICRAQRFSFTPEVKLVKGELILRFTNIKSVVMPSIEDYGYFSVTVPNVVFSDLVGVDVVRERVQDVLDHFSGLRKKKSSKPPTGLILYGPPGTGKTSVAKAIANELGKPFIMVTGADFCKRFLGDGVESVKKLFNAARRYKAVVFIDEIDGLGSRDSGVNAEIQIIDAFLAELDGFKERETLVIGATNRYEELDPALTRPGRLSLKIELGNLRRGEHRRQLIELELKKIGVSLDEEIVQKLVETTDRWSPADLIALINEGVRKAEKAARSVEFKDFVEARTVVLWGEDPQSKEGTPEEMYALAAHEAGHAVASTLRGLRFVQATIQGVGSVGGFVDPYECRLVHTKKDLENLIDVSLAGRAAENLLSAPTCGVGSDFEYATRLAIEMLQMGLINEHILSLPGEQDNQKDIKQFGINHRKELNQILNERMRAVKELFIAHKAFLKAVADALKEKKLLLESEILAIKNTVEGEMLCVKR
ncbi:MAG: AAA family ATPase [Clostridia bacterium]|nr:AAA family ATPase [Clostridia bacterium]